MTETLAPMVPEGTDVDEGSAAAGALARLASLPGLTTASGVAADAAGASAAGKLLPVLPELETVLPLRGLRRGSTVSVTGSRAMFSPHSPAGLEGRSSGGYSTLGAGRAVLLALLAEATTAGSWAAVVGMPDLGVAAAAEFGVELRRLALIPRPGADVVRVAGALCDGVDIVVVAAPMRQRAARQLAARARHRGAVLVAAGPWRGADVELRCTPGDWSGINSSGKGHLLERQVLVSGRGRFSARTLHARLLVPGRGGRVAIARGPVSQHIGEPEPELVAG